MKRPRALIASRVHLPEPTAASQRWAAVERALVGTGFDVEVLTSRYDQAVSEEVDGVTISRWPVLRDASGSIRGYLQYLSFDIPLFFRVLAATRPDIVLVEPPPTTGLSVRAACAIRRLPYLWYAADTWSSGAKSIGAPKPVVALLERAESMAISGAAAVVAVTEGVESGVKRMGAHKTFRVPNGIDTDVYQPGRGGNPEKELVFPYFVYGGTASEFQGATVFIDAFARVLSDHPNTQLIFVGGGSQWEEIRRRADEINAGFSDGVKRILVKDALPPKEVAPLLAQAQATLVSLTPVHSADTPYPTKILAALACGTPVIFLGGGEAADDISSHQLGIASSYGVDQAVAAMEQVIQGTFTADASHLRDWVINNRSLKRTGNGVLQAVRYVLDRTR